MRKGRAVTQDKLQASSSQGAVHVGGRSLIPEPCLEGGKAWMAAGFTFYVQVSCGFVSATVTGVRSRAALCRLLDEQHALLPVGLEENVLGGKDLLTIFEPFDVTSSLAELAGQNNLVLLNSRVVLELCCEVQVAFCRKATTKPVMTSKNNTKHAS